MLPKSDSLFHFTKSIASLKGIVERGFQPRYCLEDLAYLGIDYLGFPMTCFCDIPLSRIREHTGFYGDYGLGMTREWGLRSGLVPVVYTTTDGPIATMINMFIEFPKSDVPEAYIPLHARVGDLIPLVKPISGKMLIGETELQKDFFQESEWRFVPKHGDVLDRDDFAALSESQNASVAAHALKFTPQDVRYIFVATDSEIPGLVDFINEKLGAFAHNDIKLLTTRIVSLETLSPDL